MPNLSQVNINSVDYDLKDKNSARTIDLTYTTASGQLQGVLKNSSGTNISTDSVSLPIAYTSAEVNDNVLTLTKSDSTTTALTLPSGGSGTTNYNDLTNKPAIGGVTLDSNTTLSSIGAQPSQEEVFYVSGLSASSDSEITVSGLSYNKFARYFVDVEYYLGSGSPWSGRIFVNPNNSNMDSFSGMFLEPTSGYIGEIWVALYKTGTNKYKILSCLKTETTSISIPASSDLRAILNATYPLTTISSFKAFGAII